MPYLPDGTFIPATDEEYEVTLPDAPLHTPEHPFCMDPACPDKEDQELLAPVTDAYQDGLLTPDEATRYIHGKTI
jgi:hypothetical protein